MQCHGRKWPEVQIVAGDRGGVFPGDRDPRIQPLQCRQRQRSEDRVEGRGDFRMARQHGFADDRRRRIDDLRALVVAQRGEAERGELAVGAVRHRRIDPRRTLRRGAQRRRRIAARQGQQLVGAQMKPVGLLEGRQSGRAFDKFRRGGKLEMSAPGEIGGEVVEAFARRKSRKVVADRDDPGVVGGCRGKPDQVVCAAVEFAHGGIAPLPVFPHRIILAVEENGAVAGVFGVDVDLSGKDRGAHDVGRSELDFALGRQSVRFERHGDHVAEQRALGIDLRADDDRLGGAQRRPAEHDGEGGQDGGHHGFRDRRQRNSRRLVPGS